MRVRGLALVVLLFTLLALVGGMTSEASAQASRNRNQVIMPIIADPGTMNPLIASSTAEVILARIMFNGLTRLNPETYVPEPMLATEWSVSDDGLAWTFKLREDVRWHDGQPFTAEDVKFSMDAVLDPQWRSTVGTNLRPVEKTEVVDAHTVRFTMSQPFPAFPVYLANRFQVAPKHLLEGQDLVHFNEFNKRNPIGTGAFKMERYIPGDHISLVANEDFFLGRPHLDRIIFKILPDENTQIAQLRSGEIDVVQFEAFNLPAIGGTRGVEVLADYKSRWWALHLNHNFPLFQDKRVRQAIAYAINREELVASVIRSMGQPAASPIIPQIEWAHNFDVEPYPYDPQRALALLEEAGWKPRARDGVLEKDGQTLSFVLQSIRGNPTSELTTTILHQQFKELGMDVSIQAYEFATFITDVRDTRTGPNMSQAYVVWMTPEPEPDGIYAYFHSSNAETGSNFNAYRNAEVDELLDLGRTTIDQDQRQAYYHRIQEILHDEVARAILFYPQDLFAVRQGLTGISVAEPYRYIEEWRWAD